MADEKETAVTSLDNNLSLHLFSKDILLSYHNYLKWKDMYNFIQTSNVALGYFNDLNLWRKSLRRKLLIESIPQYLNWPLRSKSEMIAQHLILQKIDVIADYWETQTLGLKFKIPFIEYEISLEDEVLGGMIIANILKLLEIFVFPSFGGDNNGTTKSDNNDVVDINDNSTYTSNNNLVGNTRRNTVTPASFSR